MMGVFGLTTAATLPLAPAAEANTSSELPDAEWAQIRNAIAQDGLKAEASETGFVAANKENGFSADFSANGFALKGDDNGWTLPVRFAGHGWRDQALVPASAAQPVADGQKVEFHRGDVVEWYLNKSTGVEQGFTIARAPQGEGRHLEVALDVGGGFTAHQDGPNADLVKGDTRVDYDKLVVTDARGKTLRSRMMVSASRIVLSVDTKNATFPIVVDPTFTRDQKLTASDGAIGTEFGYAIAVSGATAIITAPTTNVYGTVKNGAAYVFTRTNGTWSQTQKLTPSTSIAEQQFGQAVAIEGNTALISASSGPNGGGIVYAFTRSGATWSEQGTIAPPVSTNNDGFGISIALQQNTAVIGSSTADMNGLTDSGAVYIYERNGRTWNLKQTLGSDANVRASRCGEAVALNGNELAFGCPGAVVATKNAAGMAHIYSRDASGSWTKQAEITANDAAANAEFGSSLVYHSTSLLVGAHLAHIDGQQRAGAVYYFTKHNNNWSQEQKIQSPIHRNESRFGSNLATAPGQLHIRTRWGQSTGSIDSYTLANDRWTHQIEIFSEGTLANQHYGRGLAVDGRTILVGAPATGNAGLEGAAYVVTLHDFVPPVPTLTEWAMILLGLVLAGGAALLLERRRLSVA